MKKHISILLILTILTMSGIAVAEINMPPNMPTKEDVRRMADIIKNVDYDKIKNIQSEDSVRITEDLITGIGRADYVHYAKFNATTKSKMPAVMSTPSYCYGKFGKWSSLPVNYVINPINSKGLSSSTITSSIFSSAETWDNVVSKNLFNNNYGTNNNLHSGTYDGTNLIEFAPYSDARVIAVTSIWYNRWTKQIYEFDMRFNEAFAWGDATTNTNPYLIDIKDIGVHELGHSVGLNDLYSSSCSQATMYGYASYRETKKRTLETGDINGIRQIYGK